jgi:hypothetical protein
MSVRLPPRGPRLAAVRLASLPAERRPLPSPPSAGHFLPHRAPAASLPAERRPPPFPPRRRRSPFPTSSIRVAPGAVAGARPESPSPSSCVGRRTSFVLPLPRSANLLEPRRSGHRVELTQEGGAAGPGALPMEITPEGATAGGDHAGEGPPLGAGGDLGPPRARFEREQEMRRVERDDAFVRRDLLGRQNASCV